MDTSNDTAAVSALVRTLDRDRYLSALFAPKHARGDLMALYAFNCELDRIPALVSEPALGEIRLQWWRDTLENTQGPVVSGHPVADALAAAIRRHRLPTPALQGMIDARSADLDSGGFADLQAFRVYHYKTQGAVFSLGAQILGETVRAVGKAANHAAVAHGITRALLRLPHDAAAGRVMLPLSLLHDHDVLPEEILAGEGGEAIAAIVSVLAAEARGEVAKSRAEIRDLPGGIRSVFAPLALVEPALAALEKPGLRALIDVTEVNPLLRFFRIWRGSRARRI